VDDGTVVAGVPAKKISSVAELDNNMVERSKESLIIPQNSWRARFKTKEVEATIEEIYRRKGGFLGKP
jgi:hypothetical protein